MKQYETLRFTSNDCSLFSNPSLLLGVIPHVVGLEIASDHDVVDILRNDQTSKIHYQMSKIKPCALQQCASSPPRMFCREYRNWTRSPTCRREFEWHLNKVVNYRVGFILHVNMKTTTKTTTNTGFPLHEHLIRVVSAAKLHGLAVDTGLEYA